MRSGFVALAMVAIGAAAIGGCGVDTTGVATGDPTGTETATGTSTPGETPTPTPTGTPSTAKMISFHTVSLYLYDDSEPWITEPGEMYFNVTVNGGYHATPEFDGADATSYTLDLPQVDLELGSGDVLTIGFEGLESDPTGYDQLGRFDVQYDASTNFGEGQHTQSGMLNGANAGFYDLTYAITVTQ
jgi:hypothetical protein